MMALSRSDLMRLLESIRTADGVEPIRVLCERNLQELIEAEATEVIGAAPRAHSSAGCRRRYWSGRWRCQIRELTRAGWLPPVPVGADDELGA